MRLANDRDWDAVIIPWRCENVRKSRAIVQTRIYLCCDGGECNVSGGSKCDWSDWFSLRVLRERMESSDIWNKLRKT